MFATSRIDLSTLRFELFDEESQRFVPLSSNGSVEEQTLTVALDHFSTYSVTGDRAHWATPSIEAATAQMSRGSSSYSYPILLPKGPARFGPHGSYPANAGMMLQYSSGIVNSMVGDGNTDTGWVGLGWTLELGYIVKNDTITLNNLTNEMQYGGDGHYYLTNDTSMRITPIPLNSGRSGGIDKVQDDVLYQATAKDGTVYAFGRTTGQDDTPIGSTLSARWRIDVLSITFQTQSIGVVRTY